MFLCTYHCTNLRGHAEVLGPFVLLVFLHVYRSLLLLCYTEQTTAE